MKKLIYALLFSVLLSSCSAQNVFVWNMRDVIGLSILEIIFIVLCIMCLVEWVKNKTNRK